MRITGKKLLGLFVIAYGIYMVIDVARSPDGLGPVFREWTGLSSHPPVTQEQRVQPAAQTSDVPVPGAERQ
jgi:hypothetical protein